MNNGTTTSPHLAGVESRRFRTWEQETPADHSPWRIVMRYGWERTRRSAILRMAAVAAVMLFVFQAAVLADERAYGIGMSSLTFPIVTWTFVAAIVALLVGAPSLAEDRRFNAGLLYFSKPVRAQSYLAGKTAHLAVLLAGSALLPLLVTVAVAGVMGLGSEPPMFAFSEARGGEDLRQWEASTLNTFGEAVAVLAVVAPAGVVAIAWIGSISLLASSYTTRAWQAALAAAGGVGGASMLGAIVGEGVESSVWHLFGPMQWLTAVLTLPLELMFSLSANPDFGPVSRQYDHAGATIVLAYLLLLASGAGALWLTAARVRAMEAES